MHDQSIAFSFELINRIMGADSVSFKSAYDIGICYLTGQHIYVVMLINQTANFSKHFCVLIVARIAQSV